MHVEYGFTCEYMSFWNGAKMPNNTLYKSFTFTCIAINLRKHLKQQVILVNSVRRTWMNASQTLVSLTVHVKTWTKATDVIVEMALLESDVKLSSGAATTILVGTILYVWKIL